MKELILIASLLSSPLTFSGIFGKKTDPILRVLLSGDIVKVEKGETSTEPILKQTGLNIHCDSVATLINYAEELKNQKMSSKNKKALILELFTDPPLASN